MRFIKLLKAEFVKMLGKKPKKKARFSWALGENKYLTLQEVEKLKGTCVTEKDQAIKTG